MNNQSSDAKINEGDLVNIHFQNAALFQLTVLYTPQATGDSWHLKDDEGRIFYVQIFEYMQKFTKEELNQLDNTIF